MIYEYEEYVKEGKGNSVRVMDLRDYFNTLPDNEKTDKQSQEELQCTCPYCMHEAYKVDKTYHGTPYTKQKLYIKRDFSAGFCFRCNTGYVTNEFTINYNIPSLLKELGAPSVKDLDFTIKDPRYSINFFKGLPEEMPEELIDLMYNRCPYILNHYKELGFRPIGTDKISIPFYWKGELIYHQIWQKNYTPKYFTPPVKNKPLYICGPIKRNAVIVEGVFDAVAELTLNPDWTPIAILGSTVTVAQELMLRSMLFDTIYIRMDDSVLSYKVYNKIKRSFDFTDIKVIESNGEDPEEELCRLAGWNKS